MKFVTHTSSDPAWCFARVPGLPYYMRTHRCVAHVECSYCKSVVSEPCKSLDDGEYTVSVHVYRKDAWRTLKKTLLAVELSTEDKTDDGKHPSWCTCASCLSPGWRRCQVGEMRSHYWHVPVAIAVPGRRPTDDDESVVAQVCTAHGREPWLARRDADK